ncbi:MAG TPA: type IV secretion system protein [Polyangiales bacterium]|nr:type IV secretion system protein [Polyangiales bacterium]
MEAQRRKLIELMVVMGATFVCALAVTLAPAISEAQLQSAPRLQSVQDFVQPLWDLEKRAIAAGQRGAGMLFTGLATIHLIVVGLQSLFRGSELQGGVGAFVEQLFWTTLLGTSIAMGPTWALAIVEFFRDVGRGIATGENKPQLLLDLAIQFFSNANGGVMGLIGSSLGGTLVTALIVVLAGLINLVTLAVECEVHFVIAAGTVVLGFGGAAFTRSLMSAFWYYTVSAGIRSMLVEMIDGATMQVLIEATKEAQRTGSTEAAATLAVGLLVVCGFLVAAPIVAHVLISSSLRSGIEGAASALPRAAIAGGISGMGTAALKGLGGAMGALAGGRGKTSGSSQDATDSANASAGGPSSKRPNDGGAVPSPAAASGAAAGSAKGKSTGVASERGRTGAGATQTRAEGVAQGGDDSGVAARGGDPAGEDGDAKSAGGANARPVNSAPLPASWQGGLGSGASTPRAETKAAAASQGKKAEQEAQGAQRSAGAQGVAGGRKGGAAAGSPSTSTSTHPTSSSTSSAPSASSERSGASLEGRLGKNAENVAESGESPATSRGREPGRSDAGSGAGSSGAFGSSASPTSTPYPAAGNGQAQSPGSSNSAASGASEGPGRSRSPGAGGVGASPLASGSGPSPASSARNVKGENPAVGIGSSLSAVETGTGPRGRANKGGAAPEHQSAPAFGGSQSTQGAVSAPPSSPPAPLRPASSTASRGARTMRLADERRGTTDTAKDERLSVRSVIGNQGKGGRS